MSLMTTNEKIWPVGTPTKGKNMVGGDIGQGKKYGRWGHRTRKKNMVGGDTDQGKNMVCGDTGQGKSNQWQDIPFTYVLSGIYLVFIQQHIFRNRF